MMDWQVYKTMQGLMIVASLILWFASIAQPQLGSFIYLYWLTAFILMFYGWSLFFAITALIATSSFRFLDLSSKSTIISTILPWCCGLATFIIFMALVARYASLLGSNTGIDGSTGSYFDGGAGGCDGGGGDGC
jgi:hypothetical protein